MNEAYVEQQIAKGREIAAVHDQYVDMLTSAISRLAVAAGMVEVAIEQLAKHAPVENGRKRRVTLSAMAELKTEVKQIQKSIWMVSRQKSELDKLSL